MPAMSPLLRRPGLLLSVAVTITVPGVLAILAVLGHEHTALEARAEAVSLGSAAPPASLPAGSLPAATGSASSPAARHAVTAMEKARLRETFLDEAPSTEQRVGMHLLVSAAAAGRAVSYQGVELIAQSGVAGTVTTISDVWHRGGGLTVTQTSDAATLQASQSYVSYDADNRSPEGVFGVTNTLVALLGKHYVAVYQGVGSALGRPALIVELRRADGSLAARFWLDRKTLVPLRRDVYDTSTQLISEDAFVQVQFGTLTAPPQETGSASTAAQPAWSKMAVPTRLLAQLNGRGWRLPAALPDGLALYAAAQSKTGAGEVADLGYSDGLSVISLFVQRGTLVPKMTGWQPVSVGGHLVFVAGHSIAWAGRGLVYTMIADAPPQTVQKVIASLPQNTAPGFLTRIGRGLNRMATLVNPFH